jgi:hypothetical protein
VQLDWTGRGFLYTEPWLGANKELLSPSPRRCAVRFGGSQAVNYLQKPSMQNLSLVQAGPSEGSHSEPRLALEPQIL